MAQSKRTTPVPQNVSECYTPFAIIITKNGVKLSCLKASRAQRYLQDWLFLYCNTMAIGIKHSRDRFDSDVTALALVSSEACWLPQRMLASITELMTCLRMCDTPYRLSHRTEGLNSPVYYPLLRPHYATCCQEMNLVLEAGIESTNKLLIVASLMRILDD